MKFENADWRFKSPAPMPNDGVHAFMELAMKTAAQGRVHDIVEDFKGRFSHGATSRSSSASWAESDLRGLMWAAADNAALFVEAFVNACDNIKQQGYAVPDRHTINAILAQGNTSLQIDENGTLVNRWWLPRAEDEVDEPGADEPDKLLVTQTLSQFRPPTWRAQW